MRSPGFEPGLAAWKAAVLPLDYDRIDLIIMLSFFISVFVKICNE